MSQIDLSGFSADQLRSLINDCMTELAVRAGVATRPAVAEPEAGPVLHTIRVERGAYNHRRMGQPYIATATFDASGKHTFDYGTLIGCRNGDAGELTVKAKTGDVVVVGQRDNKRADYSEQTWHIVQADGSLEAYDSKLDVIKTLRA